MPNNQQGFDINALKTDPKMWMRLAMPSKNGKYLENVFKDKENPFEKNNQAAVETLEKLAAEGKLYLRDLGRSRHFHKVEKTGEELKLGAQHEIKLSNSTAGFGLSVLMRLSRAYFKWIGLDRISNWFDGRLKRRAEINALNGRYKEEYKAFTKDEKKALKALRKHEKNLKKLEKIQKETEKTQKELDELQGVDTSKTKGEMDSPLSQPPTVEQKENTMQPTLLGDQPVQQIPPAPPLPNQFAVKQTTQQEIPDTKKEEKEQGENTRDNKITINGMELTDETINQFPPHVVEAFRVIQQMILEQEAAQRANQQEQAPPQPEANQEEQVLTDVEQPANLQGVDDLEINQENQQINQEEHEINQEEHEINQNQPEDVYLTVNTSNVVEREMTQEELERMFDHIEEPEMTQEELERMFAGADAPTMDGTLPGQEIDSPLTNGADLEPEQVNIQERHEDQAQMNLQERLAAEKEAMESVTKWENRLANTLFSNEGVSSSKEYYETIKDKPDGPEFLAGTVCGLLSTTGDPESKKQIMEGLLSGKPLGNEHNSRINESITAYHNAVEQMSKGDSNPMTKLITDAALELGRQASQEDGLSPRHVMIGRMISNAMSLADQHSLHLKFNDEQWATIRGAAQLSKLAEKHHAAKQFLGQEPMDVSSREGRKSVRDLLMGNAVENLIQTGKYHGQQVTDVQILMGCGCLTVDNLRKMMRETKIRKEITEERVRDLMELPNSYDSARTAKQLGEELLTIAQGATNTNGRDRQMDMQRENQPENEQQLDPAQLIQPV